mgnify:CR=1 FL=1
MGKENREYQEVKELTKEWLTPIDLLKHLRKNFGQTKRGNAITSKYIHSYILVRGKLSQEMGGNVLIFGKFRGEVVVKLGISEPNKTVGNKKGSNGK